MRQCSGLVETWDGVPLDTTVTLPDGQAGRLPLVVLMHGFGNSKWAYLNPDETAYTGNAYTWARRGYAVLTYTARGLWGSCGTPDSRAANPVGCAKGYIHLADTRYEVRDAQELIGRLVDEGTAHRKKIGITGDSYGGGQTLALAALAGRMMLPDGRLVPWRTPAGRRLRPAATAPVIPWSDLITAVAPNGLVSATAVTGRLNATSPVGVPKTTIMNGIFAAAQTATGPGQPLGEPFVPGRPMGYLAPPGSDPQSDVASWVARTDLGEPYDDRGARRIVQLLADYHSAYYIDPGAEPAPTLIASGFTDDIFPVDEALRYANRTRQLHPRAPLSLFLGDFGHQRAANKPVERRHLIRAIRAWLDHHVRGQGRRRGNRALAYVQTCPRSAEPRGPLRGRSFAALARGTIATRFGGGERISSASAGAAAEPELDPISGGGGCVELPAGGEVEGGASYELKAAGAKAATAAGAKAATMIGSLTVRARLSVDSTIPNGAQIAARLFDVAPDGTRRLVARGSYRPRDGANRWQLHPAAWRFNRGHSVRLDLLGGDLPYSRPSNGDFEIRVRRLRAKIPIRQHRAR